MKITLKGILRTLFIVIILFIVITLLKNIYLYNVYEHGNKVLIKIEGTPGKIEGRWKGIFDTWEHGKDERHILEYHFSPDCTGIFMYKFLFKRVDNNQSNTYSWKSLLPFDENAQRKYQAKVFIDSMFIVHVPDSNSLWRDTVYARYKIRNDSLFIDRRKQNYPYSSDPVWGLEYSGKVPLKKLIIPL